MSRTSLRSQKIRGFECFVSFLRQHTKHSAPPRDPLNASADCEPIAPATMLGEKCESDLRVWACAIVRRLPPGIA